MVGYIFAGQGSQCSGMGKDLYDAFPESRAVFDQANKTLGFDLKQFCFSGTGEALKMTHICQPAVLTASIAAFEAFKAVKKVDLSQVGFVAGLSLGEYSALVASGVLKFSDALRLVRRRAELMGEAASRHPGKMAAIIGLDSKVLGNICLAAGRVTLANLNCPGQVVVSGEPEAVDKVKEAALAQGAKKALDLEVSGAFHSELMWEAAMEFKNFLEESFELNVPNIPLVSNVDAKPKSKVSAIKENLVKQIYSPVLWEDSMRFMLSQGIVKFFEFGPGRVLKGLMRKIEPDAEVTVIEKKDDLLGLPEKP